MKALVERLKALEDVFDTNERVVRELGKQPHFSVVVDGVSLCSPLWDAAGRFQYAPEQAVEAYGEEVCTKFCDEAVKYLLEEFIAQSVDDIFDDIGGAEILSPESQNCNKEASDLYRKVIECYDLLCSDKTVQSAVDLMRACYKLYDYMDDVCIINDLNRTLIELMDALY